MIVPLLSRLWKSFLTCGRKRLALSIDDSDPETLAWASITSAFMVGDSEREIEMADRAVALNPIFIRRGSTEAGSIGVAGQPEEAVRSFELAIRKSPIDPHSRLPLR